ERFQQGSLKQKAKSATRHRIRQLFYLTTAARLHPAGQSRLPASAPVRAWVQSALHSFIQFYS
ncbi:hypothetical protein, partial [Delftia sp.]|uniref:hypothetical protein n=1 Tax=Delftia sp. TaxID=1886637 RepID=UPI00259C8C50